MLDQRNHQDTFAEQYVRALAAAAGVRVYEDDDGLLGFRYPEKSGYLASPAIDVRVMSCATPSYEGPDLLFSGLDEVAYNELVEGPFLVPRHLFVVVVPQESDRYAQVRTEGLTLGRLCYHRGFEDEQPIASPSATRPTTVRVPLGNVLTARSLRELAGRSA